MSPSRHPHHDRLARPGFKARAVAVCTVAAACAVAASSSASAANPGLPSVPQVPKPPALPQVPSVQPPPVALPAPPSAPQVQVPGAPSAPPVSVPSLPGSSTGGVGRAAPGVSAGLPGQGNGGSAPYSSSNPGTSNRSAPDPAARRRSNHRLRRSVRNLQGCLSAVEGLNRRVLVLRTGLGGRPAGSRSEVARRLGVSQRRVARAERTGLKSLRGAARSGDCESGPSPMAVSRTPWLMPLSSASTGLPLLSMASLAGEPRDEERSAGAVLGVTRSGSDQADGADSPGSLVSGDEAKRQPKRVAASTGGADLLLPFLLTMVLLALLALVVVARNRRSTSIIVNPTPLSEARAASALEAGGTTAVAAPWATEQAQNDPVEAEDPEPEPEPEPVVGELEPAPANPEPRVEEELHPARADVPPSFAGTTPAAEAQTQSGSHRARNVRLAGSAAALAAGAVIRALLRVRRRR